MVEWLLDPLNFILYEQESTLPLEGASNLQTTIADW